MTYKQAYAALRSSVSEGVHQKTTSYGLVAPWLQAMEELNPGTVVDTRVDGTGRIERAFISPSSWYESFKFCLPVKFVKWVVAKVRKATRDGRTRLVSAVSDTEVEVMRLSGLPYRTVDVSLPLCSCGLWTELGYPCIHGCAALVLLGLNPEDFISGYYQVEHQQKAFSDYAKPVDYGNLKRDGVLPPLLQIKRGRPHKIRIRNRSEYINNDSPVHCSSCHQPGHKKDMYEACEVTETLRRRNELDYV